MTNMYASLEVPQRKRSKHMFTPEEDAQLRQQVERHGDQSWKLVASTLPGRSSRQCRERWRNYLSPQVKSLEWTPEEDAKLEELAEKYGKHWSQIATMFPFRTNTNVKNRWVKLRRNKRHKEREKIKQQELVNVTPQDNGEIAVIEEQPKCLIDFWDNEMWNVDECDFLL